jgi:hypothetical protein
VLVAALVVDQGLALQGLFQGLGIDGALAVLASRAS